MANFKKRLLRIMVVLALAGTMSVYFGNLYLCDNIQKAVFLFQCKKIMIPIDVIVIADLHEDLFGIKNEDLVKEIILQQPDMILMAGDMLNSYSEDSYLVTNLIQQLVSIAPVYYAMGNHELAWMEQNNENFYQELMDAGAIVLERNWVDVEIKGQSVRIGGLYDYAFNFGDLEDPSNPNLATYNFLTDFQNTDAFKIMLSHRPDSFIFADASKTWDIDLVVSGHLHGGQVVLPFFGGIYGGDQGYFPEYVHGLYEKDNINIFITSGLSTNKKAVPRWNNPPEIAVLELLPAESAN